MIYSAAMNDITPPEVLTQHSVTIIRPGKDYANFFENMVENLSFIQQLAQSVTPPRLVVDQRQVKFINGPLIHCGSEASGFHLPTRAIGTFFPATKQHK